MANMQLDPQQAAQLLAQSRAQAGAIPPVLEKKKQALKWIEGMEQCLAANNLSGALEFFIKVQRMEYEMQVEGYEIQLAQAKEIIRQLESPVLSPVSPAPPRIVIPR